MFVKYGTETVMVRTDGWLGRYDDSAFFRLKVQVDSPEEGKRIIGFTVDGRKNISLKKVESRDQDGRPPIWYNLSVPIFVQSNREYYTPYPQNHLKLLLLEANGEFQIWEIAIVSQGGDFFLTTQMTWELTCYQDGNRIVCPAIKWPQLLKLLGKFLDLKLLPSVTEFQEPPSPMESLEPNLGRVLWFNLAMGLGAIMTSEGAVRVHVNNVFGSGLIRLEKDRLVRFRSLRDLGQNGRGTSFEKEAVDVELIPLMD